MGIRLRGLSKVADLPAERRSSGKEDLERLVKFRLILLCRIHKEGAAGELLRQSEKIWWYFPSVISLSDCMVVPSFRQKL